MASAAASIDELPWDDRYVRELPGDPVVDDRRPRTVTGAAYSLVHPTPTAAPRTLAWSPELAAQLGIPADWPSTDEFARVFSGNAVPDGARPFAMNYGGHQFGTWARQLGDGRAIALGEVVDADGVHQTLQLKGAGPTPYSRFADGRAVLRSSLREFLCSEAMHHLGIPTTRALSLVLTGDEVVRDVMYDGHPAAEPGAVVCRVAPSFTRFGTFELPATRNDRELLEALVSYTIRHDFPHLWQADVPVAELVPAWFAEVVDRTADLVVEWMRVGFVHGVLNTDNMSILGLTIDYGPYGWLEDFDPTWTPNTTDADGRRYAYGRQPGIALWNLLQLGNALVQLTRDPEPLQAAIERYGPRYADASEAMLVRKLGLGASRGVEDEALWSRMYDLLVRTEVDQVIWFRDLARVPTAPEATDDELLAPVAAAFYQPDEVVDELRSAFAAWLREWAARVRDGGVPDEERIASMDRANPRFVLRNWLAQEAIDLAEAGDSSGIDTLLDVLRRPYDEQPGREHYAERRPEWARHRVGCSMLSCSS
jgi:uncharacterized protein YdiU (UPF0061 family)